MTESVTPTLRPTASSRGTVRNITAVIFLISFSVVLGTLASAAFLFITAHTHFPAFGNSHFLRSLTTAGQVMLLFLVLGSMTWAHHMRSKVIMGGQHSYWSTHVGPGLLASLCSAGITTVTLGIPLAATKLYLHGITGDQAFRTQYLTRMADTVVLRDMAYQNLPPFYPAGWFWAGGRFAHLVGLSGWEAFKPWAIISLAAAASLITALWTILVRIELGVAIGTVSCLILTTFGSTEPYAGIVAVAIPIIVTLAWQSIQSAPHLGSSGWVPALCAMVLLGISAQLYTLFTALPAIAIVLMGVITLIQRSVHVRRRSSQPLPPDIGTRSGIAHYLLQPVAKVAVMGVGSLSIALICWSPYVFGAWGRPRSASGSALHYLPENGASVVLPMFRPDAVGVLCLIGLIWIIVKFRTQRLAQALALGILAMYGWMLASMAFVVFNITLLGFRVALPLTLMFALAGMCGLFDTTHRIIVLSLQHVVVDPAEDPAAAQVPLVQHHDQPILATSSQGESSPGTTRFTDDVLPLEAPFTVVDTRVRPLYTGSHQPLFVRRAARTISAVVFTLAMLIVIGFAQDAPIVLADEIQLAYIDTDGHGVRADRFPAGIAAHYPDAQAVLLKQGARRAGHPVSEHDIILLTTEEPFLSYYPFWAFQAISPHYANPLGLYAQRNELIEQWALADSPTDLLQLLDKSPFPAPTAFLFRREGDNLSLLLSEDVYPNQPNVHEYQLTFPRSLFEHRCFVMQDVGPLTAITRICRSSD